MGLVQGAFAPIPTPITNSDSLDLPALLRHLEWLSAEGLDGALILGTNGEYPSLSQAERREVATAVAESPLQKILCIGSTALPEVLELLELASDHAYDAVLCPPPYYFREAPVQGLAEFFRAVLNASKLPVLLYHFPRVIGVPISDELLDLLGSHPKLVGAKDSSGEPAEMQRLLPRFIDGAYFVGSDRLVQNCRAAGGRGSITAAASVAPALVKAVQEGTAPQDKLDGVRSFLEEFGLGAAVKAILRARGLGEYRTRPPLQGLDPEREKELLRRLPEILD